VRKYGKIKQERFNPSGRREPMMKKISPRPPAGRVWLVLVLATVLVALGALYPLGARADGSKFPTKTPTITPSPTVTQTPTETPSPTWTQIPSLTPVPLLGQEGQEPPPLAAAPLTTPSQGRSSTWLACWPVALFLFLAIVVGATYLLTRRARLEEV
jgi:hypothetical protein